METQKTILKGYKMTNRVPSSLGREIRAYRDRHGLTQRELGERCGVGGDYPQVVVSDLETGFVQNPQAATLTKIRRVLDNDAPSSPSETNPAENLSLEELCRAIHAKGFAVTLVPLAGQSPTAR
jgi:transcriptional regulator with XRE-family HTH domain